MSFLAKKGLLLEKDIEIQTHIADILARDLGIDDNIRKMIRTAVQCSHLGMATQRYQSFVSDKSEMDERTFMGKDFPCHWEVSWAYLAKKYGRVDTNELLLSSIFWSHAKECDQSISFEDKTVIRRTAADILSKISPEDLRQLDDLYSKLDTSAFTEFPPSPYAIEAPTYFFNIRTYGIQGNTEGVSHMANSELFLIRSILIAAEYYTLGLTENQTRDQNIEAVFQSLMVKPPEYVLPKVPVGYNGYIFDCQKSCAEEASKHKTTVVRGPAGLGKTLIGILWCIIHKRPCIWVCPRNVIADAVYNNIIKELEALGIKLRVQVYYANGIINKNYDSDEPFSADITVTNLDATLSPMIYDNISLRLSKILESIIIYDEFHECVSDSPLFAAFVIFMKARNILCGLRAVTLLLSATPTHIHKMWDDDDNQTTLLPSGNKHYDPIHQKEYEISLENNTGYIKKGTLITSCSISRSYEIGDEHEADMILHSKFCPPDKHRLVEQVSDKFKKGGSGVDEGLRISAANILNSALDISFVHGNIIVTNPEMTLQPIGRVDRWGNDSWDGKRSLALICYDQDDKAYKTEVSAMTRFFYTKELRKLWVEHLRKNITSPTIRLSELYRIYNDFYDKYSAEHAAFYQTRFESALVKLTKFVPRQFAQTRNPISGKTLRNPSGSFYFTVPIRGSKPRRWLGPDQVMSEDMSRFESHFKAQDLVRLDRSRAALIKELSASGFEDLKYLSRKKKDIPLRTWKKIARCHDTPIPDFNHEYDERRGLLGIDE